MFRNVAVSAVVALLAVLAWPAASSAQPQAAVGKIKVVGTVVDAYNAQPLPGVTVEVVGSTTVAVTELDGRYTVELPAGEHELRIVLSGYGTRTLKVNSGSGPVIRADVTLSLARFTEEVTVTAEVLTAETSTAAVQLAERKKSTVIQDNLGSAEMKQNADGDAAAAMQRVTGLSVVGDEFVFVRGLGERYSATTLNGASLPSTDFERRVISLDIFPSGLLDSVSVVKSYTPDRSADFAGGLVEIIPSKLPNRPLLDGSYTFGANSQTYGKDVLDHDAGGSLLFGMADSGRALPGDFPDRRVIRGGIYTPDVGVLRTELERLGELLPNTWSPSMVTGKPNQGFSLAFGNRFGKLGLMASVNQSFRSHAQGEEQNYYRVEGGRLTPFTQYDYNSTSVRGSLAAVLGAGYQFTPNQRVSFQAFSTNKATRQTRTFEGFNDDTGRNLRNARQLWLEESLFSGQVTGEHLFGGRDRVDWRVALSRSNRDEPDIRETLYEEIGGRYQLADESQSGFRMFNDMDEETREVSVNWSRFFTNWAGLPTMIKAGPYYSTRDRDFASRRFRFAPINTSGIDMTGTPESLFTPANIGPKFELREDTRSTDFYAAEQTIAAGYAMIDLPLSNRLRLIGGVRVERFEQQVDTFDLFDVNLDDEREAITNRIEKTDVFPTANLVFAVRPDQNLRFGLSQTVNRPEFREVSPFEFTDIVGGRAVVGNASLERSLIRNVDARWEWFPRAEEVIAASVFFKSFAKPIERFVEPTAQLRTSFVNAKSARNFGLEFEARRRFGQYLLAGANYTYIDSKIELEPFQTNVLTTLSRPLAGTSKHILNAMVEARVGATSGRFLINYFGDRISDVGSLGLPEIIEVGRPTLDFVFQQRIGRMSVRFAADNLTDQDVRFEQGDQLQQLYRLGRTISLQFGFSAF